MKGIEQFDQGRKYLGRAVASLSWLLCEMGKGGLWHNVELVKSVLGKPHTSVSSLVGRARAALLTPWAGICPVHKLPNLYSGPTLRLVNAQAGILMASHEVEKGVSTMCLFCTA